MRKKFKIGERVALTKEEIVFYTKRNILQLYTIPWNSDSVRDIAPHLKDVYRSALAFWKEAKKQYKVRGYIVADYRNGCYRVELKNKSGTFISNFDSFRLYKS